MHARARVLLTPRALKLGRRVGTEQRGHTADRSTRSTQSGVQVLPELKGILISAQGAQMLEILRAMPQLQRAMRTDQVEDTLVPMLLRGLAQGDTRLQEEVRAPAPAMPFFMLTFWALAFMLPAVQDGYARACTPLLTFSDVVRAFHAV